MGKIRKKARLHSKAAKLKNAEADGKDNAMDTTVTHSTLLDSGVGGGVFSKLDIDINALQTRLNEDPDSIDVRSSMTSKSFRGINITKKDKRNLRHHVWLKKVDALKEAKKEQVARKKRQKTAVVGDMKPLEDTLPTLELLLKDSDRQPQPSKEVKNKPTLKSKARQKQMNEDVSLFSKVMNHPVYKKDPLSAIKEHLESRMSQEDS